MKNAYIAYYTHLVKLKQIANKQTLFLSHMLTMMWFDEKTKQNIVTLSPATKRRIMTEIGAKTNKIGTLKAANSYISRLQATGFIKAKGGGEYLIDPECYGYAKYVPLALRMKAKAVYCSYEFTDKGVTETYGVINNNDEKVPIESIEKSNGIETDENGQQYIIDDNGEKIELT